MEGLRKLFVVLVSVAIVVAGCGGGSGTKNSDPNTAPGSDTTKTTPPAPAKEIVKLTLPIGGERSSIIYLPPVLAEASNFFKDEALDVEVIGMKGGAQAAQALVSGEVDFASLAVEHAVKSKAQGVDLVMLALYTRYPAVTLIVDSKLKDKIKTVSDLKGMKVGVTSPGSGTHKVILSLLDKFGLKPSDVEVVGVGTSGVVAALESGKVAAAVALDPWVTQLTSTGKAYTLWDLRTKKDTEELYGGDYPFVGLMTRKDVIEKKPDVVARVVKAVVRANQFLATNGAEAITAKLPADVTGEDKALYIASLRSNLEAYAPDGIASTKGLQIVIDSLKKDKAIPENVEITPAMVFVDSYARTAG